MPNLIRTKYRRGNAVARFSRLSLFWATVGAVFFALALPSGLHNANPGISPAHAASEDDNPAGSDGANASTPPQLGDQGRSQSGVIKQVAGVSEETELSDEEELEAIRNGWGTWRTADGPESVVAQ
ncbi:MAG: hypothetical protein JSU82_12100 [Rhodospirillales bacterium]|nr:MAG: hypothetical protein JSU82_12100 [Rhodospirillales bacterium]